MSTHGDPTDTPDTCLCPFGSSLCSLGSLLLPRLTLKLAGVGSLDCWMKSRQWLDPPDRRKRSIEEFYIISHSVPRLKCPRFAWIHPASRDTLKDFIELHALAYRQRVREAILPRN